MAHTIPSSAQVSTQNNSSTVKLSEIGLKFPSGIPLVLILAGERYEFMISERNSSDGEVVRWNYVSYGGNFIELINDL